MSPPSQNVRLTLGLVVVLASLAGCAGVISTADQPTDPQVRLDEVYVNNEDAEAHAVEVVIQRNETVAYWKTVRLNGTDDSENGTVISHGETIESTAFGDAPGQYAVLVRLDDRTTGERVDVNEVSGECEAVSLQIETTDDSEIVVRRDAACN